MMKTMYPKQYEDLKFWNFQDGVYFFYAIGNPGQLFRGDYSDFELWRRAQIEKEMRENAQK